MYVCMYVCVSGMTNVMFLPPGGLVIEMVGEFKDVNMPVCGYYSPMVSTSKFVP